MNYHCDNPSCDLCGEPISEKIARRRELRCESCGAALVLVGGAGHRAEPAASGQAELHAVLGQLPTVLAVPVSEFLEEANPVVALWHVCDVVELSLRLLVIIGIAEHGQRLPDALARELAERIERPTMGAWLGMAQAVARHLPATPLTPELKETVERLAQGIGDQGRSAEVGCLSLRNLLAHGGGMRRIAAEKYLAEWRPRVADIIGCLSWLADCQIVGRDRQGQLRVLRGLNPQGEIAGEDLTGKIPAGGIGALWLVRGDRPLVLWPLARYAAPGMADQETEAKERGAQIYIRRGEVRLQYLNLGGDEAVSDSDPSAVDSFLALFQVNEQPHEVLEYSVRGFESDLCREANRRIGRENELAKLREAINQMGGGVLWLGGVAGMGKSCLIAAAAVELLQNPPEGTLVLAYRFRASDDRCFRETFTRFAIERIEPWDGLDPREKELPETTRPIDRLRECLSRVKDGRRVLFVVDGLDEITERDSTFVKEVILHLASEHAGFICVGRPERGVQEALRQAGAIEPFPEGLPPMSQEDVRAMLVARTEGQLRKRLVRRDKESGDKIINPFIERVMRLSEGLPLYVNYVVGDVLSGKIAPETEGQLPAGLHAYHEELLRRCAIGDLQAVATPVVATLAVTYEALTVREITALLVRRGVMKDTDIGLVGRALAAIASMIRFAPSPDGTENYTLFHESLRQHILQSEGMRHTVSTTRAALAEAAQSAAGDVADKYLYRCGIRHLLDEGQGSDSLRLLTDFGYVMARLERLGGGKDAVAGYYRDWAAVRTATPLVGDAEVWWDVLSPNRHLLMRGGMEWGAHKILLQLAVEHADDSPLTGAAETFLSSGKCKWLWLRTVKRPKEWSRSPCVEILYGSFARELSDGRLLCCPGDRTLRIWDRADNRYVCDLRGHSAPVWGAIELSDGNILSWSSSDPVLRLWDRTTGESRLALAGHSEVVEGAIELKDRPLLSWSTDGTLRIWDRTTGQCHSVLRGPPAGKWHLLGGGGAQELSSGGILSWSNSGEGKGVRIWDRVTGQCVFMLNSPAGTETHGGELSDGYILSWGGIDHSLRLWDLTTGQCTLVLQGHSMMVKGALKLSDGHLLSWSNDATLRTWDLTTGQCVSLFQGHPGGVIESFGVGGAVELRDGQILSWAGDATLRIWDRARGKCCCILRGHSAPVSGGTQLSDGRLLSWSEDGTLRVWDSATLECVAILDGHTEKVANAVELSDGYILSCSGDGTIRIWSPSPGDCALSPRHRARVRGVVEMSDGRFASWADRDSTLRLWDATSGDCILTLQGHTADVYGALELVNGHILSWAVDSTMRVWDPRSGEYRPVIEGSSAGVKGVLKLSKGRILAWCMDKALRVWDEDCRECRAVLRGHTKDVEGATELPDGRVLSWGDKTLRIWDSTNWQCLSVLQGGPENIRGVLPLSGKRFLCWSWLLSDNTLRVLDEAQGGCTQVLKGHVGASILGAMELPTGYILSWDWASSTGIGLNLWNASTGVLLQAFSVVEVRRKDPALWWRFICASGEAAGEWAAVQQGLFHRGGACVSCTVSGKLNGFWPCRLQLSGMLTVSCGTVPTFLRLMFGSQPVSLEDASQLLQHDSHGTQISRATR